MRGLRTGGDGADFKSGDYCLSVILDENLADRRVDIVNRLTEKGVGSSVYYPRPVPHMSYYRDKYGFTDDSFPNAATISYRSIALPVGPHLDTENMMYIATTLKKAISEIKK